MVRWFLLAAACGALASQSRAAGEGCSWAPGWHGGYYLTDEDGYARAVEALFRLLDARPAYKAALEIEPYTLERMLTGERFQVERRGRDRPTVGGWNRGGPGRCSVQFLPEAAHTGERGARLELGEGAYVNLCQPLDARSLGGVALRFSAWIRGRAGDPHLYLDAHQGGRFIGGSGKQTEPGPPDGRWRWVSMDYTVPQAAELLFPQVRLTQAPGDADADGLSLVRLDTVQELLRNPGLEASSQPSLKDEPRLERLREYVRAGRIEIVGGAYTQPITYTLGQESVVQQLVLGQEAVQQALGEPVQVYAAQEPDWCGQMPQLLLQAGFKAAVYRTNWQCFGAAPARDADLVWWVGPDGSRLPAVPMPAALRAGWGLAGPNPSLLAKLAEAGLKQPLFLELADFAAEYVPAPDSLAAAGWIGGLVNFCRTTPAGAAAGQEVELSAWLRTRQLGAHLYLDSYAGARNLGGVETQPVEPDGRWHQAALRYRVPPAADRLYPQARAYTGPDGGGMDVAGLKLRLVESGEVLAEVGDLADLELPEGWGAAGFEGAQARASVGAGDVPVGRGYIHLDFVGPPQRAVRVTPGEHLKALGPPSAEWVDAYTGFEHRYPWGILAGNHLLADRRGEDLLLALGRAQALRLIGPQARLADLWRLLLMGHHHDVWVCAPVGAFGIWRHGYRRYVDLTAACAAELRDRAAPLLHRLAAEPGRPEKERTLVSLAGTPRPGLVAVRWAVPKGWCRQPLLVDKGGRPVPARLEVAARYPDGSAKEVVGSLLADLPAVGWRTYAIEEARGRRQPAFPRPEARAEGGRARLSNGLLSVEVGPEGIGISRDGQAVLAVPAHLAGVFPEGPQVSRFSRFAVQAGDAEAVAEAGGEIGTVGLSLRVSLPACSPAVVLDVECDFGDHTYVGEGPEDPPLGAPWAYEDRKLRWVFPLRWAAPRFLAHGAFELREPSRPTWPVVGCALATGEGYGLALYPDRSTGGVFRREPPSLELVLAYGGRFIYAPGEIAPLEGQHRYRMVAYPFSGTPEEAGAAGSPVPVEGVGLEWIWRPGRSFARPAGEVLQVSPGRAAIVTACSRDQDGLAFRLWRPYPGEAEVRVNVAGATALAIADLAGRPQKQLDTGATASLRLRPQAVVTLRATFPARG